MFRTKQLSYPASPLTLRSPSGKSPYATSYPAFVVTTTKASDEYFILYHIIEILSRDIILIRCHERRSFLHCGAEKSVVLCS